MTTSPRPRVALSTSPLLTEVVERVADLLSRAGYEPIRYPADGTGGRLLEEAVRARRVVGVIDLALGELADERFGGLRGAGPDRLTGAGLVGLPQVVVPGGLDLVSRARDEAPVQLGPEEMDGLGKEVAFKLSAARGPTVLVFPARGLSARGRHEGVPTLLASSRHWMIPSVPVVELDCAINDPVLADRVVELFVERTRGA